MKECFFAYSDKGNKVSNAILEAVATINNGNDVLHVKTWDAMSIEGSSIPDTVVNSIDECDCFLCDITVTNMIK